MKHSPEPWHNDLFSLYDASNNWIADLCPDHKGTPLAQVDANGKRIVAAIREVRDIPTEMLEAGVIEELLDACKSVSGYFYSTVNPRQMPATIKRAFDVITKIEEAKARGE